jgi:excisionase family DNA binding protein
VARGDKGRPELLAEWYTTQEAAKALSVTPETIRRAVRSGVLTATLPGGRDARHTGQLSYRIHRTDLERWFFGAVGR